MKKRFLSLALALAVLLSLLPVLGYSVQGAGSYTKAVSLSVGDRVVLVCQDGAMELSAISTTNTKYGIGTAYTSEPGGIMLLEVCKGSATGTFAFKYNEKYLYWGSGNTLNLNATLSANTSWQVTFDADGNATILNSADTTRQIWWNVSAPRFACYTAKTASSSYYTVQLYKASANACTHGSTNYTVTVPPTCTEKGEGKHTCTSCGVSWTVSVAALGHNYGFASVSGAVVRSCTQCGDTQEVTLNTLAEARAYTSKSVVYNVQGIVTYIKGRTVYIEDSTGGMCVYFDISVATGDLKLGDQIFVSSTMTTYQNMPEMNNPKEYLLLSSGNSLPNTTNLSVSQIMEDLEFAHLGKRVTLKNLSIGTINSTGYTVFTDSQGDSISAYAIPALDSQIQAGNKVDVTGVISYFDDKFQILINPGTALTDVVKVGEGTVIERQTVPIATAKAGADQTYYQVEGIVTCMKGRQIFIQDETGGIVIYLSSMPATAPCAVGDEIRVYGSFGNYDGVLELQYVDHSNPEFFEILSSGNQVVAQPVTIEELLADSAIEYELFAEKVFLDDVSILEIDTDGSVLLWQDDYTITIYSAPALNEGCEIGAVVDVTATVSGYNFNYELVIVDADAILYGSECRHEETMAVNVLAPTCMETGYSGDLYCTVCGEYLAPGEVLPTAHSVITVNATEATCESAGYSGEQYCEFCGVILESGSVIPPLGHDAVAETIVPPTCTENGYTIYACTRCGSSFEGNVVGALGHSCTYLDQGENHSYTCKVCGQQGQEEHSYSDGFCQACGAPAPMGSVVVDENIVIRHSLNLASDISINFAVSTASLEGYDSFYLECVRSIYEGNDVVGEESIFIDMPTLNGSYYYFTLSGINATQMGDEISATLYMNKGDQLYCSEVDVYSVAIYAYSQLNKTGAAHSLRTLCADLLQYGTAAQKFKSYRTDSPVDGEMTAEHKAFLTDLNSVTFGQNSAQLGDLTAPKVTWQGKSLVMDSKVTLRFVFDASAYSGDVNALQLRVTYKDRQGTLVNTTVENPIAYNTAKGWYAFDFDGLLAAELRTVVSIAVYAGDTRLSETMEYSADSYGNGKTGNLLTVCKAMIAYSDSALAYFNA